MSTLLFIAGGSTGLKMRSRQTGLSMIELLLAAVLGVFVMGGLGTVYISSQQTYALRAQIGEMDANARIALHSLKEHISHAGYSANGQKVENYILPKDTVLSDTPCLSKTNRIYRTRDRPRNEGDSISVSFIADQNYTGSCLGNGQSFASANPMCVQPTAPTVTNSRWYNSFRVDIGKEKNSIGDNLPQLMCGSSTGIGGIGVARSSIALGIESLQLRYGVDSDNNQQVDTYLQANEVDAGNHWSNILLVQVALLVRSIEPVFSEDRRTSYQLLDEVVTPPADRYKRAVYTTVIRLPNVAHPLM